MANLNDLLTAKLGHFTIFDEQVVAMLTNLLENNQQGCQQMVRETKSLVGLRLELLKLCLL